MIDPDSSRSGFGRSEKNIWRLAGENFAGRDAIYEMRKLGRELSFAASALAREKIGVCEPTAFVRMAEIFERDGRCEGHGSRMAGAFRHCEQPGKFIESGRDSLPDFALDFFNRSRGIDHYEAVRFGRRQLAVGCTHFFVKL